MHRMNRYRLLVPLLAAAMLGAGSVAGAKGTADAGRTDEKKPAAAAKSGGTTKAGKPGSAKHGSSKGSHSDGGKPKAGAKAGETKAGKSEGGTKSSKHKDSKKSAKSRSSKSHAKSEPPKEKPKTPASRPTTLASVDPSAGVTEIEPASLSSDDIATVREAAGLI